MDQLQRLEIAFRDAFGRDLPAPGSLPPAIEAEVDVAEQALYLQRIVHFARAVVEPLRDHGLGPDDRIVDVASGDGELAAALALAGHRNVTLWDLDTRRLANARRRIEALCPEATGFTYRNDDAVRLEGQFDAVISCQTIEHLSDEGNYAVARRSCQLEFMRRVRAARPRLVYVNVPNYTFPVDGHDTGLWFFHYLPMSVRRWLIRSGRVTCSWAGISRPVSLLFFRRQLPEHRLATSYYAFDSFDDYMRRRPPYDYVGGPLPAEPLDRLSRKKKLVRLVARTLGRGAQLCLPNLCLIYERRR